MIFRHSAAAGSLLCGLLAAAAVRAETIRIELKDLAFSPAQVSAHVGDIIEWVNNDYLDHTATARDAQWDVALPSSATRKTVLKRPGQIDYYCRFHPNMTGRITVAAKAAR